VTHAAHHLPAQVALFKGERFPKYSKWRSAVGFEPIRPMLALGILPDLSIPAALLELPVLNEDDRPN